MSFWSCGWDVISTIQGVLLLLSSVDTDDSVLVLQGVVEAAVVSLLSPPQPSLQHVDDFLFVELLVLVVEDAMPNFLARTSGMSPI
jgi:hypothetical protein